MLLLLPSLGVCWVIFLRVGLTLGSQGSYRVPCATCSPALSQDTLPVRETLGAHISHLPSAFLVQGSFQHKVKIQGLGRYNE